MSNLTMKQKVILGIVIGVMLIVVGIYGYVSLNNDEEELDITFMENSEMVIQENDDSIDKGAEGDENLVVR